MRILLGLTLLLALFALAFVVQRRFTSGARAERDAAAADSEPSETKPGWGRAIVGAPSGADPVEPVVPPAVEATQPGTAVAPPTPATETPAIQQHTVRRGESLTTIASHYYGSGSTELARRLALYNKIARVDSIREGQVLSIPPIEVLPR